MTEATDYKHKLNKIMSEKEAVATFLHDGDSFTVGGFLLTRESDSVFREIARQGQKNLKYMEESSTYTIDILIGTGQLVRFDMAYIAHRQLGAMLGFPNLERCLQEGRPRPVKMGGYMETKDYQGDQEPLVLVDWTNFQLSLRLVAGAMNVPYMPTKSSLGTDIPVYNKELKVSTDPFNNEPLVLVPAVKPDVAFITVQRADRRGNGQVWGFTATDAWKARAAKHVVLFAEEIVPTEKIYEHPANTVIPAYCTDAVVHLPFNSHPFAVYGSYVLDPILYYKMVIAWQTPDGFKRWMDEWVYGCDSHMDYCEKVGWAKLERLAKSEHVINKIPE
jgi:glutaconate CoA-transferase, subunit A